MAEYLTTEGLRQILKAIKERFSKNGHKHTVNDISDLKLVAKTGKYSDLSGLPTIPSVAVAKYNKAGIVMPGDGIVVSDTGALSINVDKESGLYIENNLLKASFTGGESYSTEISAENWVEIYRQLIEVIEKNKSKRITDYTVVLKNTYFGKTVSIKFDKEKLSNFESIHSYAFTVMGFSNFPKKDSFANIGGYAKDIEDLKYYEFFKLLASDEISDAVEVFFYNYANPSRAKEQIGKYLQDIILVYDELERFEQLGIKIDKNLNNVVTTYVYNKDESGTNYIPLSLYLGSFTPEPSPEPEPEPSVKKYSISCLSYDIDIENSIEGNGYSDSIGDINTDCKLNSSKQSVELDESFEITTNVSDDRVIRSGYIIIKDDNYIPSDKIKPNYKGYIAYKFGNSGKTLSLSSLIESAKKYNPEEWVDTMPLPIYTIAKANPITENQTDRIWKADIAQHNTWFYDFGDNTAYVNRRLYFSDDSWGKIKNTIDETGSNIICIIVSAIKHDIKDQGFKNVYLSTDVSITTDGNGVRLVESELGDVTKWTETTESYHRQWIDSTASPLTNPKYRELNKYNSVNFTAGAGSVKTYKEKFILYRVPDDGEYKGKWIAISTEDKTGEKWSDEFIKMRNKIPSLWFLNMSGDGVSFQWTVSQYQQVFALVVEKSGDEQNRLTINYVDDKNIGVLTLQ